MHFDTTITLGTVLGSLTIVIGVSTTIWRTAVSIRTRLDHLLSTQVRHEERLNSQDRKIDKQDEVLVGLVRTMERLVGRMEATATIQAAAATASSMRQTGPA
jgi:hypothetical protein